MAAGPFPRYGRRKACRFLIIPYIQKRRPTDRVGVRVTLSFDEAGRIVKPLEPVPYVSR